MRKKWWIVLSIVVILGIGLFATPYLVNVNTYRAVIESELSQAANRQVSLNELRLSLVPLAIESHDVRISEDPSFGKEDFVRVRSLRLHLNFWPLLRRQIQVTSLELVEPDVRLVKNARGDWNFSTLGSGKTAVSELEVVSAGIGAPTMGGLSGFDVSNLSVKNAHITILDQTHPNETTGFDIIDFTSRNIASGAAFPFSLTVTASERKEPIHIDGEAGPLNLAVMADSPCRGTLEAKSIHYGKIGVENLRGKFTLARQVLKLDPLEFDLYGGHHIGAGTWNFQRPETSFALTSRVEKVDVNQFLSHTTTAKGFLYGLLNGNLTLSQSGKKGSDWLRAVSGRASVDLQKGKLAHLSLGHEILTVAKLTGINFPEGETPITKMSGHFDIADNWARSQDLEIATPEINLLCQGGFNFDDEMNFDVLATFSQEVSGRMKSSSPVGGLMDALLADKNKQIAIPFQVSGSFQKPHFKLDSQRLLSMKTHQVATPSKIQSTIQSLQDLFKKK